MSKDDKQVTQGGRFLEQPDALVQVFGESVSFDKRLAPYDLTAVWLVLNLLGWPFVDTNTEIEKGINELFDEIKKDSFAWKLELEGVHEFGTSSSLQDQSG